MRPPPGHRARENTSHKGPSQLLAADGTPSPEDPQRGLSQASHVLAVTGLAIHRLALRQARRDLREVLQPRRALSRYRSRHRITAFSNFDEPETRGGNPTARQTLTGKCRIGGGTMRQPRRHRAPRPEQRDEV